MAAAIDLPSDISSQPLEQQIQSVADRVTRMITSSMERKQSSAGKRTRDSN
jgi:hypothetical protein